MWIRSYSVFDQAAWLDSDPSQFRPSYDGSSVTSPVRALFISVNGGIGVGVPGWGRAGVHVSPSGKISRWWWPSRGSPRPGAYPYFGAPYKRPWHGFILKRNVNDDWANGRPPTSPPRQWVFTVPYWFPVCATAILAVAFGRSWWKARVRNGRGFPVTEEPTLKRGHKVISHLCNYVTLEKSKGTRIIDVASKIRVPFERLGR